MLAYFRSFQRGEIVSDCRLLPRRCGLNGVNCKLRQTFLFGHSVLLFDACSNSFPIKQHQTRAFLRSPVDLSLEATNKNSTAYDATTTVFDQLEDCFDSSTSLKSLGAVTRANDISDDEAFLLNENDKNSRHICHRSSSSRVNRVERKKFMQEFLDETHSASNDGKGMKCATGGRIDGITFTSHDDSNNDLFSRNARGVVQKKLVGTLKPGCLGTSDIPLDHEFNSENQTTSEEVPFDLHIYYGTKSVDARQNAHTATSDTRALEKRRSPSAAVEINVGNQYQNCLKSNEINSTDSLMREISKAVAAEEIANGLQLEMAHVAVSSDSCSNVSTFEKNELNCNAFTVGRTNESCSAHILPEMSSPTIPAGPFCLTASENAERFHQSGSVKDSYATQLCSLSKELMDLLEILTPPKSHADERDAGLKYLYHRMVQLYDKCVVSPFGSVINGFWTKYSDVDVCVQLQGVTTRGAQIKVLRRIAAALHSTTEGTIDARFNAKIPIVHWEPRKYGTAYDISINNVLAIVNSRLMQAYRLIDTRMQPLGFAIKRWAQQRYINDRSKGTLSTFALLLMLIHFLQRRPVPVLPSLQDIAISRNYQPIYLNGVDCRYSNDSVEIHQELEYLQNGRSPNNETVATLLIEFFKYYGYEYKCGIIATRNCKVLDACTDQDIYYLHVDNPFEIGKDVANVVCSEYAHIRQEFRRAYSMLSQGCSFLELCSQTVPHGMGHRGIRLYS